MSLRTPSAAGRRLILVRHGETAGESSIRYHGRNDVPLSPEGGRQMERVAQALAGEAFDAVYASRLQRAVSSARIVAPGFEPVPVAGFDEIHFGRWEGLTGEEIEARDPDLYRLWRSSNGDFTYPEGDSVRRFRARVAAAWHALEAAASRRVLVVAHRGVLSAILSETLGLDAAELRSWRIGLGSIHIVVANGDGWRAEVTDRHDHLEA